MTESKASLTSIKRASTKLPHAQNKQQQDLKHFGWELPLAKLSERVQQAGHGYPSPAVGCRPGATLHPGKARSHPKPNRWGGWGEAGVGGEPCRGCGRRGEGASTAFPSLHAHTSFHLSSDTKENLLPERNGSVLAPTQILHNGILETSEIS